jgi:hypothetical protein
MPMNIRQEKVEENISLHQNYLTWLFCGIFIYGKYHESLPQNLIAAAHTYSLVCMLTR